MINVKVNVDSSIDDMSTRIKDAQKFLVQQVSENIDSYIPIDTGKLRGSKQIGHDSLSWYAVNPRTPSYGSYAKVQYYTNTNGMKFWDKRMWADRGTGIVRSVAEFIVGG